MTVLLSAHIKTDSMLVRRKVIMTMKHFIACEVQSRQMVRDMRLVDRCCRALHALGTPDARAQG